MLGTSETRRHVINDNDQSMPVVNNEAFEASIIYNLLIIVMAPLFRSGLKTLLERYGKDVPTPKGKGSGEEKQLRKFSAK